MTAAFIMMYPTYLTANKWYSSRSFETWMLIKVLLMTKSHHYDDIAYNQNNENKLIVFDGLLIKVNKVKGIEFNS